MANLIAFIAIFSFLDSIATWIFSLVLIKNFGLAVNNIFLFYIKIYQLTYIQIQEYIFIYFLAFCSSNGMNMLFAIVFYKAYLSNNLLTKGVEIEDCQSVAKLVGYKVFVNEFVAYTKLGHVIEFRKNIIANQTLMEYRNGTRLLPNDMPYMIWNVSQKKFFKQVFFFLGINSSLSVKDRSIVIATYALCGFANFGLDIFRIRFCSLCHFATKSLSV